MHAAEFDPWALGSQLGANRWAPACLRLAKDFKFRMALFKDWRRSSHSEGFATRLLLNGTEMMEMDLCSSQRMLCCHKP